MIYYVLLMVSIIFADQLTKWLAVISLKGEESFPLWEGVFHFTYVENTGSAFGMLKDHRWVFMTISTVVIIGALLIFFIYYKKLTPLMRWSICFLVAGGIGNMIDRIFLGYVVDFFDFTLIDFAVFNVADSFVCIGAGLLVLWFILDTINERKAKKVENILTNVDGLSAVKAEESASDANDEAGLLSDVEGNAETSEEEIGTEEIAVSESVAETVASESADSESAAVDETASEADKTEDVGTTESEKKA